MKKEREKNNGYEHNGEMELPYETGGVPCGIGFGSSDGSYVKKIFKLTLC